MHPLIRTLADHVKICPVGRFTSQIYLDGRYFDVTWRQTIRNYNVIQFYIESINGSKDIKGVFLEDMFLALLFIRSQQIEESKQLFSTNKNNNYEAEQSPARIAVEYGGSRQGKQRRNGTINRKVDSNSKRNARKTAKISKNT